MFYIHNIGISSLLNSVIYIITMLFKTFLLTLLPYSDAKTERQPGHDAVRGQGRD
jgi:hypothetical protein